ncbi:hypothetical protein NT239_14505 [Chitinibacter sp. SCUT-21]|uniref:imelysin family protein n=1 Tax=Chitinibacter sp. SCUT-21 TaxID=2970891 RepID=UPI0035A67AFB
MNTSLLRKSCRFAALSVAICCVAAGAQAEEVASSVAERQPLSNMEFTRSQLTDIHLAAQANLAQISSQLVASSRAFCAAPSEMTFRAVQTQYVQTLLAWRAIEIAPMGPSAEPDVGKVMEGQTKDAAQILSLAAQKPAGQMVDGQAAYEAKKLPDWGIGFKAIEELLYGDKPANSMARLSTEPACGYLVWQSQVVAYQAETLRRAWQGLSRGAGYDLSYPRTYLTQYLNSQIEGLRDLSANKLGIKPSNWLDQRSGATVMSLQSNVAGLRTLLTGNQSAKGLDDLMLSRDDTARWAKVEQALTALEASLPKSEQALTSTNAKKIARAASRLADVLEKDIAPMLAIKIGKVKK